MRIPPVLRQRSFLTLWLSAAVSDAGDWLLFIALPVVVFTRTGSALGTSTAFLFELVPGVLLAPFAGWCVDRFDRRRLGVAISLAQAVALVPLLVWTDGIAAVYLVIATQASLAAIANPIRAALVPLSVGPQELGPANSLMALGDNLARLVGGPIGGVLLAVGGLPTVVVADGASFVVAAALLTVVRVDPSAAIRAVANDVEESGPRRRYLRLATRPDVRRPLIVLAITQMAQGLFLVLFVVFVVQRLRGGAAEVGLLRGVQAIGALVGGIGLTVLGARRRPTTFVVIGAVTTGLIELAIWNAPTLTTSTALYVVLFILVGAPGLLVSVGLITQLQAASDSSEHGRVFSLLGLTTNVAQGIGIIAAGVLVTSLGTAAVLNGQAVLFLLAGAAALGLRPRRTSPSMNSAGPAGTINVAAARTGSDFRRDRAHRNRCRKAARSVPG